ncbi:YkvA family protein [Brachyspira pilosicoli]|uniref:YkvA family protein n=1 Tax=Brachyspira pilosicoli TaxID=52584 RepID=UPI003005AA8F
MYLKNKAKKIWLSIVSNIDHDKLESLVLKTKEIFDTMQSSGKLYLFKEKIELSVSMIKDYVSGNYKNVPWKAISAIAASLVYLLLPFDAIADFFPLIGLLDDAFIIGLCIKLFNDEIEKYREWKYGIYDYTDIDDKKEEYEEETSEENKE